MLEEEGAQEEEEEETVAVSALSLSFSPPLPLSLWEVALKWRAQERNVSYGGERVENRAGHGGRRDFNWSVAKN